MGTDKPAPVFLFEMHALQVDSSGYKVKDWGKAMPISIIESTCDLAHEKCRYMLGNPNAGMTWATVINSVKEVY